MNAFFSELRRRNVLRVAALYLFSAWLVAQVTDVVTGLAGWPPSVGRAVLLILACGFPVAIGLAWLFEWTPAGIRRDSDEAGVDATPRRQRIDYVILAVLVVALGYFAINHDWRGPPAVAGASIAVLPFANRSALPEDRYFVDGVHDDLLTQLAKIRSLVVISRTSVMQYRDSEVSIPEIGAQLGVATVLEGAVQRAGGQVRINLQLIEVATDKHLWAEVYDRPLTAENVFEIQSEIATTIAGVLHTQLLPEERRRIDVIPTKSLEAYEAYLHARTRIATRDLEGLLDAEAHLLRAIDIDPDFALAHARLAEVLSLLSEWDPSTKDESLARAEAAATRALVIDPELGDAYTSRGLVKRFRGLPYEAYEADMARGVELSPGSAEAHKWYSNLLGESRRYEEALVHIEKAVQLDPMSPINLVNLGSTLEEFGRHDEAQAAYLKALEIDPTFLPARFSLTSDEKDDTLVALTKAYRHAPTDSWFLVEFVVSWLDLEDVQRAGEWFAHLEELAPGAPGTLIACVQVNVFRNELQAAAACANQLLPVESAGMPVPSRVLANRDIRAGDPAAALDRYRKQYPQMFEADPPVADNAILASDIALVLLELGSTEQAQALLAEARAARLAEQSRSDEPGNIPDVRMLALQGKHAEALALLRELVDRGWNGRWWFFFRYDLALAGLHGDPAFVALEAELGEKAREGRERARQLEAEGKIMLPPGVAAPQ